MSSRGGKISYNLVTEEGVQKQDCSSRPEGISPGCRDKGRGPLQGMDRHVSHHLAPSQGTVPSARQKWSKFTYSDPNHINKKAPQGSQMSTLKFGSFAAYHTSSTPRGGL